MWALRFGDFIYKERGNDTGYTHLWQTSGSVMCGLFEYLIHDYIVSDTNFMRGHLLIF